MAEQEKIINIRVMRGVDLNANARLIDPGTYRSTTNLYARLQGILELRPGSKLVSAFVTKFPFHPLFVATAGTAGTFHTVPMELSWVSGQKTSKSPIPFVAGGMRGSYIQNGLSYTPFKPPEANAVPKNIDATGLNPSTNHRVSALEKFSVPFVGTEFLVGAMSSHYNDYLFYMNTSNQLVPIVSDQALGIIHAHDAQWQMQVAIQSLGGNNITDQSVGVLCVNGVDVPIWIKHNYNNDGSGPPTGTPFLQAQPLKVFCTQDSGHKITGATCVTLYGNQMIWGGACLVDTNNPSNGDVNNLRNCLMFSNPSAPQPGVQTPFTDLAGDSTVNGAYVLQIGDTPSEWVTAVVGSPALTDGFGAQGQLIAWTGFKTQIYNGPVPSSGNPAPPGFGLAAIGTTGTWSPKSIQRTEYGTVFLGSDGVVYMVALNNRIVVIGRALEPLLGGKTQTFYKNICSYYKKGFYHLFFPQNVLDGVNKLEFVADLRGFNTSNPRDGGVEWFGPWTGRYVNCVKVARGINDPYTIYAGLGHLPAIIELERADTYSDPNMANLGSAKIIYSWGFETGDLDLGDAHLDKICSAFSIGIATQNTISVKGTVAAMSDIAGVARGFTKTKTVKPNANTLGVGNGFNLSAGAAMSSLNNFALPTWQPGEALRGRAFNISVTATPTIETFVRISDLEFRVKTVERRATDI